MGLTKEVKQFLHILHILPTVSPLPFLSELKNPPQYISLCFQKKKKKKRISIGQQMVIILGSNQAKIFRINIFLSICHVLV